jgi:uncharacterized protein (TIGR01777 family)
MKLLLAGGTGLIGRYLVERCLAHNHQVWVLTRNSRVSLPGAQMLIWDGSSVGAWGERVAEMDAVVNLAGYSLSSWPWTEQKKERFRSSRVDPGLALAAAIESASRRPAVLVQMSGVNHYGLSGASPADEDTPPANDFLSRLTVDWENATRSVEPLGVRRVVCRTAVVLARDALLMRLLALPVQLFVGGPLGSGGQALPWIHVQDQVGAILYLIETPEAQGPYNLIAPHMTSNEEFMRAQAEVLGRPYWFRVPAFLMRAALGQMSQLVLEGRFVKPSRLTAQGYKFQFPEVKSALRNIFNKQVD